MMESLKAVEDQMNQMSIKEDSIAVVGPSSEENEIEGNEDEEKPEEFAQQERQNLLANQIFKNPFILDKIVKFFPGNPTSLASVSFDFCASAYSIYREKVVPEDAFLRIWKYKEPKLGPEDKTLIILFCPDLHYHPNLMKGKKSSQPQVQAVQAILTFTTDLPIVKSTVKLPSVAVLGCPGKVCFITKQCQEVQLIGNKDERGNISLVIPKNSQFDVRPLYMSNSIIKLMSKANDDSQIAGDAFPKPLRAIFVLQLTQTSVFEKPYLQLNSKFMISGAIMPNISVAEGPDERLAVGFAIFANPNVKVGLYGFDATDDDDTTKEMFETMQADLEGKQKGFAIFLWTPYDVLSHEPDASMLITDEEMKMLGDADFKTCGRGEEIYDADNARLLESFKTLFPDIPVIGGYSPHILYHNEMRLACIVTCTFLVVAY